MLLLPPVVVQLSTCKPGHIPQDNGCTKACSKAFYYLSFGQLNKPHKPVDSHVRKLVHRQAGTDHKSLTSLCPEHLQ